MTCDSQKLLHGIVSELTTVGSEIVLPFVVRARGNISNTGDSEIKIRHAAEYF